MPRVLVVDDDETIRDSLYELLSEEYLCQTAETAEKAFARLEADTYDVVLTDISMPGLSGLELLGQVRQRFPETPVIIISGISDEAHAQGLIKLGAFDFLLKPFTLDVVGKSVKRAVEFRRQMLQGSSADEGSADGTVEAEPMLQGSSADEGSADDSVEPERLQGSSADEGSMDGTVEAEPMLQGSSADEGSADGTVEAEPMPQGSSADEGRADGTVEAEPMLQGSSADEGSKDDTEEPEASDWNLIKDGSG